MSHISTLDQDKMLFLACTRNNFIDVKNLLEDSDANPFIPNEIGISAADVCSKFGYDNILRLILTKRHGWLVKNAKDVRNELRKLLSYSMARLLDGIWVLSHVSNIICEHVRAVGKTPLQMKIEGITKGIDDLARDVSDDVKTELMSMNTRLKKIAEDDTSSYAILDDVSVMREFLQTDSPTDDTGDVTHSE